eukprot:7194600-Prymnesium_polylepis.1
MPTHVRAPWSSALRRAGDSALMAVMQVALIVVYTSVLIIKTCDPSLFSMPMREAGSTAKAICSTYGFGESST